MRNPARANAEISGCRCGKQVAWTGGRLTHRYGSSPAHGRVDPQVGRGTGDRAELNRDLRPGRFVLAGSTRYSTLPQAGQALTGRVDILDVLPLTQAEISGSTADSLVHRLLDGTDLPTDFAPSTTTREEYARRITSGGMPVALRRPPGRSRSRWFANYLELVIERDVIELSRVRQREMLPRLLNVLAARSGQVLNIASAAGAVGMEKSSAENYLRLLEAVFLTQRLPAWGTTSGSRVTRQPKFTSSIQV